MYYPELLRYPFALMVMGGASLSFPLFGFDGYAAELNGEPAAWRLGANNRLTLDVPAGTAGTLNVRFRGKAIWRVTDAISLMTALCTAAYCCKRRKSL